MVRGNWQSDKSRKGDDMNRNEAYRYIGLNTPQRRSCDGKARYASKMDAAKEADEYNRNRLFADMGEYRCKRHQCWHIGHRNKHVAANMIMLECVLWFQEWHDESQLKANRLNGN